jgi:kynurenine formamidase
MQAAGAKNSKKVGTPSQGRRIVMSTTLAEQLHAARVYDLEQPRFAGMPIHPSHRPGYFYALHRRHRDTYRPDAQGPRSSASGVLTMMEHSGTHVDALCHQACGLRMFGGVEVDAAETPTGFARLGIETVPPLLGRGVLLDVCGHKGERLLPPRYGIRADELASCAAAQGVEVRAGDVLLVRTGYGALWHGEEQTYLDAAGVSKSGTLWAAERGVAAAKRDLHHRECEPGGAGARSLLQLRLCRHPVEVPGSDWLTAAAAGPGVAPPARRKWRR